MNETNKNPVIRVYPQTRQRLKVMAAQRRMTMQDLVEWLVAEQEREDKKTQTSPTYTTGPNS